MQERRRDRRFAVDIMGINGRMMFARDVKIHDISIGGVSLKADSRLNIGSEYILKIEWKGKVLAVKGIVVWSLISESIEDSKGNIIPIYTAGMKFTDVSDEKLNDIINFIDEHKKVLDKQVDLSKLGTRLHVRAQIETRGKTTLDFHESYKVKKLSLGGMLIESVHVLETENKLPMEVTLNEEKSIKFIGRVASCFLINDKDIERYDIGIEFLHMSDKDRTILDEFIRLLENLNAGTLSGG